MNTAPSDYGLGQTKLSQAENVFGVAPLSGTGIGCCAVVAIRSSSPRYCGTVSARGLKSRLFGWPRPSVSTDPLSQEQTRCTLCSEPLGVSTSHGHVCHTGCYNIFSRTCLSNNANTSIYVSSGVRDSVVRFNSCIIYNTIYFDTFNLTFLFKKSIQPIVIKILHCSL